MNANGELSPLLRDLEAIDDELSFEEHLQRAAEALEAFLTERADTLQCRTPILSTAGASPYLRLNGNLTGSSTGERSELLHTAVQLVNHHLSMVHDKLAIIRAARTGFHEFVHPLSHYMKSPLTAILGYSSLLEEELESGDIDEMRHYVRRIGENTKILVKMIDDLLYLSRLKKEPVETLTVPSLVHECMEEFGDSLSKKSMEVAIEDQLPPLVINREHGRTIFTQLIGNALRHSEQGQTIRIGIRDDEFFIADQGAGISNANLEKVFRVFFTTCGKDTRNTGAGLFTVKKILELYGGSIRVESSPGMGATFLFKLRSRA
jgi:signal transduction histidine kinase